jgi:hypothetical protein
MYCVVAFFLVVVFFCSDVYFVDGRWLHVFLWPVQQYLIQLSERLQLIFCAEPSMKLARHNRILAYITKTILSYAYLKLMSNIQEIYMLVYNFRSNNRTSI